MLPADDEAPRKVDPAHWRRISACLDEALDLDAEPRASWLARLAQAEPQLADEVAALLAEHDAALAEAFLEGVAPLPMPAPNGPAATLQGRHLGAYTLQEPIGQGGMGSVWRALRSDGQYNAFVAIKLLNTALIGATGLARFKREGSILARLQHPHIAHLLDAGVSDDGQPYLVLELVEGEPIDAYCTRCRLGVEQRLGLFLDALSAVAHAHTHLVVHRDLKPSNVLVMSDGQVKLLDFGIAKLLEEDDGAGALTQEGTRALTPQYAAPEQLQGGPITTATDVYALGVMLYQLLGGRHPTGGDHGSAAQIIRATLDTEPARLSDLAATTPSASDADIERIAGERATSVAGLQRQLRGDLDNIVARALSKPVAQRYPSVAALADDLRRHLAHEPVSARPASLAYRCAKFVRRNRLAVSAAFSALLLVLAGVLGTGWQAIEARHQRDAARAAGTEALAQAALAEQQRRQALASAAEAASQRVQAESQRSRAEQEAADARRARTATEAQLAQTRVQREEAIRQARRSQAANEFITLLLAEVGPDGRALTPAELLDRGRELLQKNYVGSPTFVAEMMVLLAGRYGTVGHSDRVVETRLLAETAARRAGDPSLLALALCAESAADIELGRVESVVLRVAEARRLLSRAGARARLDALTNCDVAELMLAEVRRDRTAALRYARAAVQRFEAIGATDVGDYLALLNQLGVVLYNQGDAAGGFAVLQKLGTLQDASGRGNSKDRIVTFTNLASMLTTFGERLDAEALLRQVVRRVQGDEHAAPAVDVALARSFGSALLGLDRHEEALPWLNYALALAREQNNLRVELQVLGLLAVWQFERGELDAADLTLAQIESRLPADRSAYGIVLDNVERSRIRVALRRGHSEKARQHVDSLLARMGWPEQTRSPRLYGTLPLAAEVHLAAGDAEQGARLAQAAYFHAESVARDPRRSTEVGKALVLLGKANAQRGRLDEARAQWRRAKVALAAGLGADHWRTVEAQHLGEAVRPPNNKRELPN